MSRYHHLVNKNNALRKRLVDFSGIDEGLVQNFIHFSQCLAKPKTGLIELQMFKAVMAKYFVMTNANQIARIYSCMSSKESREKGGMSVEDFCRILCMFFTTNYDMRTDCVFSIYDTDGDGDLDNTEIATFMRDIHNVLDRDASEFLETNADMSAAVADLLGVTNRKVTRVTRDTFREKVNKNPALVHILGYIIPGSEFRKKFKALIKGKSYREMRDAFGRLRLELMYDHPEPDEFDKYFPITLDFP